MKNYALGAAFLLVVLATPLAYAQAAGLTGSQVSAIVQLLQSFGADPSVINSVQATLTGGTPAASSAFCYNFNSDLTFGSSGVDVNALQMALSKEDPSFASKDGFTEDVAAAVVKFQTKYGIRQTGYVGPLTRAELNALYGCSNSVPVPGSHPININWSGGTGNVEIGLVDGRFDSAGTVLGWIQTTNPLSGSLSWSGTSVSDLAGTQVWPVTSLSQGPFRILGVSADSHGNYCMGMDQGISCNYVLSNPFTLSSPPSNLALPAFATNTTAAPPAPTISSLTPSQGTANTIVTVYGTNLLGATEIDFYNTNNQLQGSITNVSGQPGNIFVNNASSLTFTLAGAFAYNVTGALQIRVVTSSGGPSNALPFTIVAPTTTYSAPTISSISPSSVTVGGTVYVWGANFDSASYIAVLDANMSIAPSSYTNSSLTFTVPSGLAAGTHTINVSEKAGTLSSNSVTLNVTAAAAPVITGASSKGMANAQVVYGQPVYINGTGLSGGPFTVNLVGVYAASSVPASPTTDNQLSFNLPSSGGKDVISISVTNTSTGQTSNVYQATAVMPAPIISSISPSSTTVGGLVYVYGANFDSASYIAVLDAGMSISPSSYTGSTLAFTVPSGLSVGTYTINVSEKASTLSSNSVALTVVAPVPTATLTVNGSHSYTVAVGGTDTISWSSTNGTSYNATYSASGCSNSSMNTNGTQTWYPDGLAVGSAGHTGPNTVLSSQAGCTYIVTYIVTGAGGTASDSVTIIVSAATAMANGLNQTAGALNAFSNTAPAASGTGFTYVWNRDLQVGSPYPEDISALQTALAKEGVYSAEMTGGFYDQTFIAVKAFQQKYGIEATGFVGPVTREKLNTLY